MTNKVLILHGWEANSNSDFLPALAKDLEEKGYSTTRIDLPNTETPKFEEWFAAAEKKIAEIGKDNLSIVGHSMGGLLSLKLAEKYKLDRLVSVTPVGSKPSEDYINSMDLDEEEKKIYREYQNRDVDVEKIKKNTKEITIIFGKKDKWITKEIRDFYSNKFKDSAKVEVIENQGHFTEQEGVKKAPEIEKIFSKVEDKKPAEKEKPKETKKQEKPKKEEAVAHGRNLRTSKKSCMYICSAIKGKKIDAAIELLESVIGMKTPIKFKGEIPHRKGKGMMSGRYPVKAASLIIPVLKALKGNVTTNGLDLDKTVISIAMANKASSPSRRGGTHFKRCHIVLKAREIKALKKKGGDK